MNIVIFTHPSFSNAQSIDKYTQMLATGLSARGHNVEIQTAKEFLYNLPAPNIIKKWLGYFDQFLIYPMKFKLNKYPRETLFVFADQALGPWIPLVSNRPHIIHCHDFLAQRSALNEIPQNQLGLSGKIYQKIIRRGYKRGKNFISVSLKTQEDLHGFLDSKPLVSKVVYNGLNQDFSPADVIQVRDLLSKKFKVNLNKGYILHVGGNQFYKNRKGVVKIYEKWKERYESPIPLIMVGPEPTDDLLRLKSGKDFASDIHFLSNLQDEEVKLFYQGASILLFPSLEEGFGWPIAEAMASGCPVITTNKAPMNEVGGTHCIYIPSFPEKMEFEDVWLIHCSRVLEKYLYLSPEARQELIELGLINSKRFNTEDALSKIESIYGDVLENYKVVFNKVVTVDPDPQV